MLAFMSFSLAGWGRMCPWRLQEEGWDVKNWWLGGRLKRSLAVGNAVFPSCLAAV